MLQNGTRMIRFYKIKVLYIFSQISYALSFNRRSKLTIKLDLELLIKPNLSPYIDEHKKAANEGICREETQLIKFY
jgi:hypothetical protein